MEKSCGIILFNLDEVLLLQYSFNNEYPTAATPLSDGSALFISTGRINDYLIGDISGDEEINVLDVVILVNCAMYDGGDCMGIINLPPELGGFTPYNESYNISVGSSSKLAISCAVGPAFIPKAP